MSSFYQTPGSQVHTINHGGGSLTLDHKRGTFFEVVANGNITGITSVNEIIPSSFLLRITANGGTRTIDLSALTSDNILTSITTLADGEFVLCQGVSMPSSS